MSVSYAIYAELECRFNTHAIESILLNGLKHQLKYVQEDVMEEIILSVHDILKAAENTPLNESYAIGVVPDENTFFRLRFYHHSTGMYIFISPSANAWKQDFFGRYAVDYPRYMKLLLDLCSSFIIRNCYVESDRGRFAYGTYNNTLTQILYMPMNWDKNQANTAQIFFNIKQAEGDFVILQDNNYDPADFIPHIKEGINEALERQRAMHMSIKFPDASVYLSIFGSELLLMPQKPIKCKLVSNTTGIDLEYYVKLMLAISNGFGMLELTTNF